jgi:fructoselysine 6-kinase
MVSTPRRFASFFMNVVCVGDCGVDRYLPLGQDRAGGITLNFAAHARRLFQPEDRVIVISALGNDAESDIVTTAVNGLGVESHLVAMAGATSIQTIDLEPSGEKIFVNYEQGVLGDYRVEEREQALIAEADLLMAPHYRQIEGFFDSVMQSPSRGLRAVDFADVAENPSPANVERYIDRFDVAFVGLSPAHAGLIEQLHRLAANAGKLVIVTLGAHGSEALSKRGRFHCPAAAVDKVIDTTGAGDTFAAGFLREYCVSTDIVESLRQGAAQAAKTIQQIGAF